MINILNLNKKIHLLYGGAQFVCAGAAYNILELMWRGYTHISMFFLGGLCFSMISLVSRSRRCFLAKSFICAVLITLAEGLAGCVLNLWLSLNVWDYSNETFQFMGQICLRFSLLWWALSAMVLPLCKAFDRWRPVGGLAARE